MLGVNAAAGRVGDAAEDEEALAARGAVVSIKEKKKADTHVSQKQGCPDFSYTFCRVFL